MQRFTTARLIKLSTADGLVNLKDNLEVGKEYTVDLATRRVLGMYNYEVKRQHQKEVIDVVNIVGDSIGWLATELVEIDPPSTTMITDSIIAALSGARYRFQNERELQTGIGLQLMAAGFTIEPEKSLTDADRIDFLVERIGIEIKVAGSRSAVLRQVHRYVQSPDLDAVILVTSKDFGAIPNEINGKKVVVHSLVFGALG